MPASQPARQSLTHPFPAPPGTQQPPPAPSLQNPGATHLAFPARLHNPSANELANPVFDITFYEGKTTIAFQKSSGSLSLQTQIRELFANGSRRLLKSDSPPLPSIRLQVVPALLWRPPPGPPWGCEASQPASHPASQAAIKPGSQLARQAASHPARSRAQYVHNSSS
jgi:hypothetical protein